MSDHAITTRCPWRLVAETAIDDLIRTEAQLVAALQEAESFRLLALQAIAYCHRLRRDNDRRARSIFSDRSGPR